MIDEQVEIVKRQENMKLHIRKKDSITILLASAPEIKMKLTCEVSNVIHQPINVF